MSDMESIPSTTTNMSEEDQQLVAQFQAQYTRSEDFFSEIKTDWKADNDFSLGVQWDSAVFQNRQVAGQERPCLVVNKIDPLVHRIVNEAKQQELEAIVKPLDSQADKDTATILTGYLNRVQYYSQAKEAYMWAYEGAVRAGFGYFRICNKYENEKSFEQTLSVEKIPDAMSVSYDPDSIDQSGRDARFAIITQEISEISARELCAAVGKDFDGVNPDKNVWEATDQCVKQAEMYWIKMEDATLYLFKDQSTELSTNLTPEAIKLAENTPGMILKKRDVRIKVCWYANIVNGIVIEETRTNGSLIPIVRMCGRVGYINGEVDYRGITRNSMDANRMYNVMSSLLVERIGLASRAPYIGAAGQFEGFEDQWLNANNQNLSKLEYNPISLSGTVLPAPQQSGSPQGDPTVERYMQIADRDIKDTSSLSDAFNGTRSNETSGAGIKARAAQSGLAILDFMQNCQDSIKYGAEVMLDIAPKILSEKTLIMIMGPDYKEKVINLKAFIGDDGMPKDIDFNKGVYGVEIDVSTGDKTRRETALEQLAFLFQTNPQASNLAMDLFVSNLDIKDADKVSRRFKAMVPPQALAAENEGDGEQPNHELEALHQQAAQIIAHMKANLDQCQAELQDAQLKLKQKDGEMALKSRELDIEEMKVQADIGNEKKKTEIEEDKAAVAQVTAGVTNAQVSEAEKEDTLVDDNGISHDISDSGQLAALLQKVHSMDTELNMVHNQMTMVTQALQKVMGGNETAPTGPAQQPEAMTTGNSPPPVEAENNVGEPNG